MKVINKIFCIIVLILVLACVVFFIFLNTGNDADKKAMIYVDGDLYGCYLLSDNIPDFVIETGYGYNKVSINNGKIGVTEADCPDKTCINMGFTDNSACPVICMPHRLEIVIIDSWDVDGVTG